MHVTGYLHVTVLTLCTLFMTPPLSASPVFNQGATLEQLTHQYPVRWISVEQIAQKLKGRQPMSVGFDIDDTLLFSSPAFYYGRQKYSPQSDEYLKNRAFWNEISNGWDRYSLPKKSAMALLRLHIERGDQIYFITGRTAPENGEETLTGVLKQAFRLPENRLNKVIFAGPGKGAKVGYIKKHSISIYYGDSDNDILDARAAKAEGIRVLRPLNSTNYPHPVVGRFGEDVIVNSHF